MKVLIIEDELQTARDLKHSIEALRPRFNVQAILDSVESGFEWFSCHESPDLIFSDIQLGDGLAFEIFKRISISCPVIFCTAYDEYAIKAFQHNGIGYLLKPVNESQLAKSLDKVDLLTRASDYYFDISLLQKLLCELESATKPFKSNFLVSYREKMIPINIDEISCFSIDKSLARLHTNDNRIFLVSYTLDYLESIINPRLFYRANRQWLVSYNAIREIEHYFDRKLLIKLHLSGLEPLIVSKAKSSDFLQWMEGH
jgi:DNA-binding LytR/AlgR family response regulator